MDTARAARVRVASGRSLLALVILLSVGALAAAAGASGGPLALILFTVSALVATAALADWQRVISLLVACIIAVPADRYYLPSILPVDVEPYRLLIAVTLLGWLAALLVDKGIRLHPTALDTPIAVFACVVVASFAFNALTSQGRSFEFKGALYETAFLAVFYLVNSLARGPVDPLRMMRFMVFLAALVSIMAVVERLTGASPFSSLHQWIPILQPSYLAEPIARGGALRAFGSAAHPIAFGVMLSLMLPLSMQLAIGAVSARGRLGWSVSSGLIALGAISTVSRTAIVGLVIVFCALAVRHRRRRLLLATGAFLVTFAVHMVYPGAIKSIIRVFTPGYIVASEVGNPVGRLEDYPRIATEVALRPFLGMGPTAFQPQTHFFVDNQYLKWAVELGIVGLLAAFLLLLAASVIFLRAPREMRGVEADAVFAVGVSALVFMVTSVLYDSFGFPQPTFVYFILLALGAALLPPKDAAQPGEPE